MAGRLLRTEYQRVGTIDRVVDDLEERAKSLLLQANVPADVAALVEHEAPTVQALFALTTDLLTADTREHFAALGGMVEKPAVFGVEDLQFIWELDDVYPTLYELLDYGLVEPAENGRYQIHAVLKAHALSLCDED